MPVIYGWRPGSRIAIDAQLAGRELSRLERAEGGLSPDAVLTHARSANSALHGHFEWDDSKAAEQHRLAQAGELIRSITVDVSRSNIEPAKPVRAFVNVTEPAAGGDVRHYASTTRALSDKDLRRQVLIRAFNELEAWRKRYAELTELAKIFAAIDQARGAE